MNSQTIALINQYATKGVLVDTNILLLYFVGMTRTSRISRFGRTQQFSPQDFDLLITFLSDFSTVVTTPNILTEVNSFINQLGEPDRTSCYALFALELPSLQESYIPSQEIAVPEWYFPIFGLTDCGIAEVAKRSEYLVLTDDSKVADFLRAQQIDIVSFDDLRALVSR